MGFDMYWHTERDSAQTSDEAYFRLNIGGMRLAVEAMAALDMVFESSARPTKDEWLSLPEYDEAREGGPEYEAAVEALVGRLATEERPGIPVHKLFSTNDGWHVRPIEIQGALHQYRRAIDDDPDGVARVIDGMPWWPDWIDYLNRAAERGEGFRVH